MKFATMLPALALGATAVDRNEQFKWGTWTLALKGSSYTHDWATTMFEGGFQSDTFVVKEIRAGSTGPGSEAAQWCKNEFKLPGVEALFTGDGHFIRTLSCDNQDAKILSAKFKATPKPGYGAWKLTMKGSSYTHDWSTVNWNGNTAGFQVKEITPGSAGAAGKSAQWCKDTHGLDGVEALYTAEGEYIRALSCDNQNAHILHASWERLAFNENVLLDTSKADTYVSGNCYVGHGSGVKDASTGVLTDGETNSRKGYWHSCKAGDAAWAKFKLAHTSSVSKISVANRADCCEERLTGAKAIIVDTNNKEHVCGTFEKTALGAIASVQCEGRVQAAYIKIIAARGRPLHVAEVMAFGNRVSVLNVLMDSKNNAKTQVSGNCHVGHGSGVKNANTGVLTDGETFSGKGYWHSCKSGEAAWAKFEISRASSIYRVDVANRNDCCENRLTNAAIYLKDADTGAEVLCGKISKTGRGQIGSVFCDEKIKANGVILKGAPGQGLNVAEVSAWGKDYSDKWYQDCEGSYGKFGACSASCGKATKSRTFSVSTPAKHGGRPCVADHNEVQTASCALVACPTPAPTPAPTPFPTAYPTESGLVQKINGKCLDGDRKNGGHVHMWDCDANNHQQQFVYDSKSLLLKSKNAVNGKFYCLRNPTDGGDVEMWSCDTEDTRQRWFYFTHNNVIKAWHGDFCLDNWLDHENKNGGNVHVHGCNGGVHQQWNLDAINGVVSDQADTGLVQKINGKCLDGVRKNGGHVHMWGCDANNHQQQFVYDSKTKMIKNKNAVNGKFYCLRNPTDGGDVEMWSCDTEDTRQRWFYFTHNHVIKAWHGDFCLDNWLDHENKNGGNVHVHGCNGGVHQQWNLDAINGVVSDQADTGLVQKINGKCLDGVRKNGGHVQMWGCDANNHQQQFVYDSKTKMIKNKNAVNGKFYCLRNPTDGGDVEMWSCDTEDTRQRWFYFTHNHVIKAWHGDFCLDNWLDHENKNGGNVHVHGCNGGVHQQWNLDAINGVVSDQADTGLVQKINGKCLDGDRKNGGYVHMWGCDANNHQQQFVYDSKSLLLKSKNAVNGKFYCLRNPTDGGDVEMWSCDTEDTRQRWFYFTDSHVVKAWHGDFCLDNWLDHENKNGGNVHVHGCNGGVHQQWNLDAINGVVSDQADTGLVQKINGKCLDGVRKNGGHVQMWGCDANNHQQQFVYDAEAMLLQTKDAVNGVYYCLRNPTDGGDVEMWACDTEDTRQKWFYWTHNHKVKAWHGDFCLDNWLDHENKNGGNVHVHNCQTGSVHQQWNFDTINGVVSDQDDTGLLKNIQGKCVHAAQRNQENGLVNMWQCDARNPNQIFEYSSKSNQIKNKAGKCFQKTDLKNGGDIVIAECQSTKGLNYNQLFWYHQHAHAISAGWKDGKEYCMDSNEKDKNGGNLHLWECIKHNSNQEFFFDHKSLAAIDCVGSFPAWKDDQSQCKVLPGNRRHKTRIFSLTQKGYFGGAACEHADGYEQEGEECTEDVDIEMEINETPESFTKAKKQKLREQIAKELGVSPEDVDITVGSKPNPISARRRLVAAGVMVITVTIKVKPTAAAKEIETLESPAFSKAVARATGIKPTFLAFKPSHGSMICATCKWDGYQVRVTHYLNAQKNGQSGLQHKCYHEKGVCKCACDTWNADFGVNHKLPYKRQFPGPNANTPGLGYPKCRAYKGSVWAMCGNFEVKKWGIGPEGEAQAIKNCNYVGRTIHRWGDCSEATAK